jgi:hypothetical protein
MAAAQNMVCTGKVIGLNWAHLAIRPVEAGSSGRSPVIWFRRKKKGQEVRIRECAPIYIALC